MLRGRHYFYSQCAHDSWNFSSKMEEILSLVKQMQNVGNLEPKIEDLVKRINKLQQAKKILNEEIFEANEHSKTLQIELEKLNAEKSSLEEIWNEKKEIKKVMQMHSKETQAEMQREQKLNLACKQQIEEITAKIQMEKLKQREQRFAFEQLLDELTEKHKNLWELYARERPMADMKKSKEQLLLEEKLIQEKLAHVQDELDLLSQVTLSEERKFLKSQAAASTLELFQEENKKAKGYLEAASKYNSDLQEKCNKLRIELEVFGMEDDSINED
ncbi:synaptonemal complex central element protein 1-like isoform X2 [Pantherophis guttatus]|uniref:Synaptonemal complex central element protein 1-like isoform X2 n=1 Tax=Pantherophis guttatus TaxID=94885 RepID=A0A6P9D2D0_PANGU|nr:synaptonemal complex central element protein 1-like isoform X2 [Pantherophis guttatus]